MTIKRSRNVHNKAFTIVELLVVIAVIGILAGIVVLGYGNWKHTAVIAQVKSDLNGLASAMENARNFNGGYPQSPLSTTLTTFTPSSGTTISGGGSVDGTTYCIDATITTDGTVKYYLASESKDKGALSGTCATRPTLPGPGVPSNLAITGSTSSSVSLSWTAAANATTYTAQCASDSAYVVGAQSATITAPTVVATVGGLSGSSTYYCHVKANNLNGVSDWTANLSTDTIPTTCADSSQYGTYPTCYAYDSLPIASSIEGYWSTPPSGYLSEDGSAVSRTTYADLFAAVGTTYGAGDGSTTFNVPDSRGRIVVNINSADAEFNTLGEKYGEKTHIMSLTELPSHNHQQYVTANSGGVAVRLDYAADGAGQTYAQGLNTSAVGSGTARNNIQPTIAKTFAIKYRPTTGSVSQLAAGSSLDGYWSTAPAGYLPQDGAAVSRTTYADLFASIGTTYGVGNGSTTFNVPDSRGRTAVNLNASDTQFASLGLKYGEKTHTVSIAEIPVHSHTQYISANSGGTAVRLDYGADGAGGVYDQGVQTASAGGGQAQNVIQPSIAKLSVIKYLVASGSNADLGMTTGSSVPGYWSSIPVGYLWEDGSAVSRTTYSALFAAIGTTYGVGNGSTTFNVPDSRGRAVANVSPSDSEYNVLGEKYGEKAHTLSIGEMPSHSHAQYVTANSGGTAIRIDYHADGAGGVYAQGQNTGNTGSGTAFNVIQPSIVARFAIKY